MTTMYKNNLIDKIINLELIKNSSKSPLFIAEKMGKMRKNLVKK